MILFHLALAFLAGAAGAALGLAFAWPLVLLAGAGICTGWVLSSRRGEAIVTILLSACVLLGIERYEAAKPSTQPGGIAIYNAAEDESHRETVRGLIADEPEVSDRAQSFTLRAEAVRENGKWLDTEGRVRVTTNLHPRYEYGDVLQLTGRLQTPPVFETFDYREYLARRGVVSQMLFPSIRVVEEGGGNVVTRLLVQARRPFDDALQLALPEPESSLARGILLGRRASIPDSLTDDFNRAGISHLIAISGQNVAIVAGVLVASFAWVIGRRPATIMAIALVLLYAAFVGGDPSVLRAAIMATVMLGAMLAGRPGRALPAVMLAAALLVLWRPLSLNDVAFQLSFAATLGIVVAGRRLQELLQARLATLFPGWTAGFLAENLAITTAASLAVLPIIAASFGRVSVVSLPANLLAAPAFVLALGGSFAAAAAGALDTGLGRLAGEVAYLPLNYLIWLGRAASGLPLASLEIRGFGLVEVILTYALLAAALAGLRGRLPPVVEAPTHARPPSPALATAALLILAAAFVFAGAVSSEDRRLRVTVLDVGQGDAILIESPAGHRILVDGGPSGAAVARALGRALPASARRIDLVVLTHPHDDHVTGLVEVLQRYDVAAALAGPLDGNTEAYHAWREALAREPAPLIRPNAGQWLDLGSGVRLEVLGPAPDAALAEDLEPNDASLVLRLVYRDVSFMLSGDLAAEGEAALLDGPSRLRATVLKVAHHGSDGSSTARFLDAVDSRVAVISVGAENAFGHPSPTTRRRLAGIPLLRTDTNGDVAFWTDGSGLWAEPERGSYSVVDLGSQASRATP